MVHSRITEVIADVLHLLHTITKNRTHKNDAAVASLGKTAVYELNHTLGCVKADLNLPNPRIFLAAITQVKYQLVEFTNLLYCGVQRRLCRSCIGNVR